MHEGKKKFNKNAKIFSAVSRWKHIKSVEGWKVVSESRPQREGTRPTHPTPVDAVAAADERARKPNNGHIKQPLRNERDVTTSINRSRSRLFKMYAGRGTLKGRKVNEARG